MGDCSDGGLARRVGPSNTLGGQARRLNVPSCNRHNPLLRPGTVAEQNNSHYHAIWHPRYRNALNPPQDWVEKVLILLTNDDGIYAPGLAAIEREMRVLGEVVVVAPATEQSGVGHAITYLTPLTVKEVFGNDSGSGERRWGWAVQGSPADCVKIGINQFCPRPPDLVLSGINSGLNAGINVLYSGTVAAAIEGAFFGITSVAVSLEFDEHARFDKAARLGGRSSSRSSRQKPPSPSSTI